MDPTTVFCPNEHCHARGQTGMGNIGIHSQKEQRFICHACHKTFSARKGTVFYRLRTAAETVVLVVTLLAHGCPLQAIVAAFGLDERTVAAWWARSGRQGQAVQEFLVERPRDLGQVQADELRVKKQGGIVWMALAMMVKPRLWLGGEVSEQRDMALIRRLIERVRRCAAQRPLLFCTDGLCAYIRAIRETFRDPARTGKGGRPRLRPWRHVLIAPVVKRYERRRVVETERRIVDGTPARVETLRRRSQGDGVINTAYMERLNATFRERLAPLARRCRALARQTLTLEHGMYLIGTVYNFCTYHASLPLAAQATSTGAINRTPAMAAGITDHGWTVRELLAFHVPPPRWAPPKQRGRPSQALQRLIARWCP
jgi:transposase-like protein/IS1 family transposase